MLEQTTTIRLASSKGSIVQVVLASVPLFALLTFLLYRAYLRPSAECYNITDEMSEEYVDDVFDECAGYIRLIDMGEIFLFVGFLWTIIAAYLTFYVPRRHQLLEDYLTRGKTTVGDVFYKGKPWWGSFAHYGLMIVPHPNYDRLPVYIQRRVRVYHNYTRERVAAVYLAEYPFSAQPKADLEIDYEVAQRNKAKFFALRWFSWGWVLFCVVAAFYVVVQLERVESEEGFYGHPDHDDGTAMICFLLFSFVCVPLIVSVIHYITWNRYLKFMTRDARTIEEGERPSSGCGWLDDDDSWEELERYNPPTPVPSTDSARGWNRKT